MLIPFQPKRLIKMIAVMLTAGGLLAGCAGVPDDHPVLQRARAAYSQAQADPQVAQFAPLELRKAEEALQKAENAEDEEQLEKLAYMAERQAQIAVTTAERKMAEKKVEDLAEEKDRVVLTAREREAEEAKREAEAKAREAEIARRQAEEALAKARELEKQLADLQATQTDRGLVLTLGDVLFETGKAELMGSALRNIDKVAEFLLQYPDRNVLVEGHTDNVGSDSYNLDLSERRANAVRLALIQRGVAPERIIARGFGESQPVASNETVSGRQQNRRVEIVILREGDTANFR